LSLAGALALGRGGKSGPRKANTMKTLS